MPLNVYFLNVGLGDCTMIEFPSARIGVVDIYNSASADRTDPINYYNQNLGSHRHVFRMIVTHPDMDHMTGLNELDQAKSIYNFWHTGPLDFNLASTTDAEWNESPYDKKDWLAYKRMRGSSANPKGLHMQQSRSGEYWTKDQVTIWAPTDELEGIAEDKDESNILSLILLLSYKNRTILLGGDATADETWPAILEDIDVGKVDVLKASHHGRKTGFHEPAVQKMSPWLTITSVDDPEHDASDLYRKHSDKTVSLNDAGDIKITIRDDGKLIYPSKIESHWLGRK